MRFQSNIISAFFTKIVKTGTLILSKKTLLSYDLYSNKIAFKSVESSRQGLRHTAYMETRDTIFEGKQH